MDGAFKARVEALEMLLAPCQLCPRRCLVDRLSGQRGGCLSGAGAEVSSWCDHHGEEPPISGDTGSGTIFFAHCNLRCLYCQNHQISQGPSGGCGDEIGSERLAEIMLELQQRDCQNINFVSPTHFSAQLARGIFVAAGKGLHIPIVYNTNGYDSLEALKLLDGIVDIYLPDIKYADDQTGQELSGIKGYPEHVRLALAEMWRQAGPLRLEASGRAVKGMIIRHLVLPNDLADSENSLRWIGENIGTEATISLMSQYYPTHKAGVHPLLARQITEREYARVVELAIKLGFQNLLIQEDCLAPEYYRPDFKQAHPFHHD